MIISLIWIPPVLLYASYHAFKLYRKRGKNLIFFFLTFFKINYFFSSYTDLLNSFKENGNKAKLLAGVLSDTSGTRESNGGIDKIFEML